jgi:hypothetical protein
LTGDNILIGGFILTGKDSKRVALLAKGPSLNSGTGPVPERMSDPFLELHDGDGNLVTVNDNWKDSPQMAEIENNGLAPTDDRESAILQTLTPGKYTAIVRGVNDGTGVALVEVYDLARGVNSILANISSRSFVDAGDNVMIGGFIAGNNTASTKVLIRAIGPSLKNNVPSAMDDPLLELHDRNGVIIATNDNWKDDQRTEIEQTGIPPTNDLESAIVRTLAPDNYTAIVRGKDNTTGVGLVEIYNIK